MEIKGYPNYLIYDDGRIYSKDREIFLKCSANNNGYKICSLHYNGKVYRDSVHKLVAKVYLDNPNNLPQVHHKDYNRQNNHISNLEWISNIANQNDKQDIPYKHKKHNLPKNISFRKNKYRVNKMINHTKYEKVFNTLDEAIKYKESLLLLLNFN